MRRHFSSSGAWNTMPTSRDGSNGWLAEPMRSSPPSRGCSPARILSSVDLPQPDGPTSETSSPGMTSKLASDIARCFPYVLRTAARWMNDSRKARILRHQPALEKQHDAVEQHAEQGDEQHRHEHRRRVERDLHLEHEIAQAPIGAEELADYRAGHGEYGAHLHAGEDVRQRTGKLDLGEQLPARALERAHQVEQLRLDLAQAARRGEQDREHADGERHQRVRQYSVLEPHDDERAERHL